VNIKFLSIPMILAILLLVGCTSRGQQEQKLCSQEEAYNATESYTQNVPYNATECKNVTSFREVGQDCVNTTENYTAYVDKCTRVPLTQGIRVPADLMLGPSISVLNPWYSGGSLNCYSLVEGDEGNVSVSMRLLEQNTGKRIQFENRTVYLNGSSLEKVVWEYPYPNYSRMENWNCQGSIVARFTEACKQVPKAETRILSNCTPKYGNVTEQKCGTVQRYREQNLTRSVEKTRTVQRPC